MRAGIGAVVLVSALGCHGAPADPATAPLVITVGAHHATARSALAYRDWNARLRVVASTSLLTCADLHAPALPGALQFEAALTLVKRPDGTVSATLHDVDFDDLKQDSRLEVPITGDGTPGQRTRLQLDFHGEHVAAKGVLDALNCEDPPDASHP